MADEQLTTIATFPDEGAAAIARSVLEAEGIPVFALDGATTTTLWHVGLGGVRLQVPTPYAQRARQRLDSLQAGEGSETPLHAWRCPHCDADVDAGFAVCWSCGQPAPDDVDELAKGESESVDSDVSTSDDVDVDQNATYYEQGTNAHATPQGENELLAMRAWRAAILGVVFWPLLAYAAVLILQLSTRELTSAATARFYGAVGVTFFMFCAIWVLFTW